MPGSTAEWLKYMPVPRYQSLCQVPGDSECHGAMVPCVENFEHIFDAQQCILLWRWLATIYIHHVCWYLLTPLAPFHQRVESIYKLL